MKDPTDYSIEGLTLIFKEHEEERQRILDSQESDDNFNLCRAFRVMCEEIAKLKDKQ